MYSGMLEELDLSGTLLSSWQEVLLILQHSPLLADLNLSRNRFAKLCKEDLCAVLGSSIRLPSSSPSSSSPFGLRVLILNDTMVSWEEISLLLPLFPCLRELYLSGNRLSSVQLTSTSSLSTLQLNNNLIRTWDEVEKLGPLLPCLQDLYLSGNPLHQIAVKRAADPAKKDPCFPNLSRLVINKVLISRWEDVEALEGLPSLTELKALYIPAFSRLKKQERRFLFLARLPKIQFLNGSEVTEAEREDAERFLLRAYKRSEQKPGCYERLKEKHGTPEDLVEVNLAPPEFLTLTVTSQEGLVSPYQIQVRPKMTVGELRKMIGESVLEGRVDCSEMQLQLWDAEMALIHGPLHFRCLTDLVFLERPLYRYRIKDGDGIHVRTRK